jgi:hypothetical protein
LYRYNSLGGAGGTQTANALGFGGSNGKSQGYQQQKNIQDPSFLGTTKNNNIIT